MHRLGSLKSCHWHDGDGTLGIVLRDVRYGDAHVGLGTCHFATPRRLRLHVIKTGVEYASWFLLLFHCCLSMTNLWQCTISLGDSYKSQENRDDRASDDRASCLTCYSFIRFLSPIMKFVNVWACMHYGKYHKGTRDL